MKTLRILGLALLVGLAVVGTAAAATGEAALVSVVSVPSVSTVGPNGDVTVPITVSPATGVVSMQFAIAYDPAVLTPTGVYKTAYADSFELLSNVPSPGDLRITLFGTSPLSGSGEVAWIVFRAIGANGTSSSLVFNQAELNEGQIASTPQGGTVNVTAAASTISMPDDANGENGTNVSIPVTASPANGYISVDLDILWNSTILSATSVTAGNLPNDWTVLSNLSTPGRAQIALFGVTPLSGTVDLVNIHYLVTGTFGEQTPLDITRGDANEGNITTALDDGLFTVSCDDGNPCTDDTFNGSCQHTNTAMGTACNSPSDTDCDNPDTCDGAGTCQPNNETNGTSCTTDGNDCTQDVCGAGVCTHPNEPGGTSCGSPSNTDCDNPDTCNGSGSCQTNNEPMGTSCTTDGNTCTTDQCNGTGTCTHPTLPDGTVCSDGNPCTQTDLCGGGVCVGSNPVIVPEINDSVRVTKSGPIVTIISWNDPPGAYNVYRGSRRTGIPWSYNQVCFDGPTQESESLDAVRPLPGVAFYYLVSRITQCGESILGRDSNNTPIPNNHPCDFPDVDGDGVQDKFDNCPVNANPGQEDADGDALGDVCDNCPNDFNPGQEDPDQDGTGSVCDPTPTLQGVLGTGVEMGAGASAPATGSAMSVSMQTVEPRLAGRVAIRSAVPSRTGLAQATGCAERASGDMRDGQTTYTLDGGA